MNDAAMTFFRSRGYTGTYNDAFRKYLVDLTGDTTGTIDDLLSKVLSSYSGSVADKILSFGRDRNYLGTFNDVVTQIWLGGGFQWIPSALGSSLALWLDAADASTITLNGSTVSQWNDKSGNSRNASQPTAANQPTYTLNGLNGKPVLTFDGSSDFMTFQTAFGTVTEFNAVVVWRTDASGAGNFEYLYQIGDGSSALSLNAASPTAGSFNGNYYGLTSAAAPAAFDFNTPAVFNAAKMTGHRIGAGTAHNFWVNGSARTVPAWSQSLNVDSSNSGLGRFINNNTHFLQGYIAEIVFVTNTALSTTDRQRLEGYLAHKWALEANLPVGHPFKSTPPFV